MYAHLGISMRSIGTVWQVQNTGHRSEVTGHCFTNTESILDVHKIIKANLRPKNFCLGLIMPNVSFYITLQRRPKMDGEA